MRKVETQWGGGVRVLELASGGLEGGIVLSGTFNAPVGIATGSGASFDMRGSGQHGNYSEAGAQAPKLEEAVGALAAAVAELRAHAAVLPDKEAAPVSALADDAEAVAQAARQEPESADLGKRLKGLADGVEQVGRLQSAVAKLEPTLKLLKVGAASLGGIFGA